MNQGQQREAKIINLVPRSDAGRVPPHNLDAEAAVLSAILLVAAALDRVLAFLRPEHFYSDANGRIFAAAMAVREAGKPVDVITVADWLRARERLASVGGAVYLATLADATPSAINVEAHARAVFELWRLRQLIATCQTIAAEGYGAVGDVGEFVVDAQRAIEEVGRAATTEGPRRVGDLVRAAHDRAREASEGARASGWSTGLVSLDRRIAGQVPGRVTVIGGRPSMGKTALARRFADAVVGQRDRDGRALGALMFSLEQPEDEQLDLWASTHAGVDMSRLKAGGPWSSAEWQRFTSALEWLQRAPIWIDDKPGLTLARLRARSREVKAQAEREGIRLAVIVIDYLQLMTAEQRQREDNREREVAELSRGIKLFAREMGVQVVLLSQLNRDLEKRPNKRPTLADLRESGSIEQDSDVVLLLYRDEYYHEQSEARGICEIGLAKHKGAARGITIPVRFEPWCTRFSDLRGDDHAPRIPD